MHEKIMRYPARALYGDELVADASVAARDLGGAFAPLTFIDTAGRGFDEQREDAASSFFNSGEAGLAIRLANDLMAAGVDGEGIGILSPYGAQVQHLRGLADELPVEVNTIDGFQGREKEVIIVSLVRSNDKGEIGFLSDLRRLNVALTRARRALIVIGDSATISAHAFYAGFVDYAIALGAHRTAWEWAE
jgi:superfamily I DNA and/or RNA helicase